MTPFVADNSPSSLQIDSGRGKLYWSHIDINGVNSIWRINLDGTQKEKAIDQLVSASEPQFVLSKNYMYFHLPSSIRRVALSFIDCPSNCSGHGQCDFFSGICSCTSSYYTGADCDTYVESYAERLGGILLLVYGGIMVLILITCFVYWGFVQCKKNQESEESSRLLNDVS